MTLSDGEKLLLLLMCDVVDGTKTVNTKVIRSAIETNNLWAIPMEIRGDMFENSPLPPLVSEVANIFDMFNDLERAYDNLPANDKEAIDSLVHKDFLYFEGFDHNNEYDQVSIAEMWVTELNRYTEYTDKIQLNTHSQVLDRYRRMIYSWKAVKSNISHSSRAFNTEELKSIIDAGLPPR